MREADESAAAEMEARLRGAWAVPGRVTAAPAVRRSLAAGIAAYRRETMLPRLIPLMPAEIADESPEQRRRILARLARALRAERNRGRAGHWTYDLNRHAGLKEAYEAERRMLGRWPPG